MTKTVNHLRKLDDGRSRPVSIMEREICGQAATSIEALAGSLRTFIEAFDGGSVQLSSPEIQLDDEQPHPWHEEWISRARTLLASLDAA